MENESLKLGRVSKNIERTLDVAIPGDVFVYIQGERLNSFAYAHPKDYLKRLEVVKDILSRPHFAAYEDEERIIYLFRTYYKNGVFSTYCLQIAYEDSLRFLDLFKTKDDEKRLAKVNVKDLDAAKRKA